MILSPNPWDNIFGEHGRIFYEPHPDLPAIVEQFKHRGAKKIVDLGCGTGRHLVYLAREGFSVYGLDGALQGLYQAKIWLEKLNLKAELQQHDMLKPIPYAANTFDGLVSTQVIHHARLADVQAVIAEIKRILKPNGMAYVTVAAPKEGKFNSIEIEPRTYIPLGGREKGLPHHLFSAEELRECFAGFEVTDIHLDDTNHYCLTGFKPS